MSVETHRWQFTVADFARMIEAGILAEDDRVELIEGEVRAMSPIGPRHVAIVNRLNAILSRQLVDRAIVSVQNPIQLNDRNQPQPDIAVLRPRDDFYVQSLPRPADVLLVIEVAEASLEYDREEKIPRYAEAGIPEVWLVNLANCTIVRFSQPVGEKYGASNVFSRGQSIQADSLGLQLQVEQIVG